MVKSHKEKLDEILIFVKLMQSPIFIQSQDDIVREYEDKIV